MSGAEGYTREERAKIGRFSPGERNTLIAFAVAITLWILPGVVALVAGDTSETYETVLGPVGRGSGRGSGRRAFSFSCRPTGSSASSR